MPKKLVVGNEEFEIPLQGENPDWGTEVTDFLEAVAGALETVQQPNDVLLTTANIANNQTTPANIAGFSFTTAEVQAINCEFFVSRSTTSPAQTITESGSIVGNFNGTAWSITIVSVGYAGITFSITPAGQIQYVSTNIIGSGYVGAIKFKAKVINQD